MTPQQVGVILRYAGYILVISAVVFDGCWLRRHPGSLRLRLREVPTFVRRYLPRTVKFFCCFAVVNFCSQVLGDVFFKATDPIAPMALSSLQMGSTYIGFVTLWQLAPACIAAWLYEPSLNSFPGWRLRGCASWLFGRRTCEEILEPILSDMQVEFCQALAEKRSFKARWIQMRGYGCFWSHVMLQIPVDLTRVVVTLWKIGH